MDEGALKNSTDCFKLFRDPIYNMRYIFGGLLLCSSYCFSCSINISGNLNVVFFCKTNRVIGELCLAKPRFSYVLLAINEFIFLQ